jgi:uncharacterized repeat protein (TIGR01451 family)
MVGDTLDTDPASAGTPSTHVETLDAPELAGTKTITETVPAGWSLTSVDCTGVTETTDLATRTTSFTVNAGDTVVCTFTNTKHASLTVVKVTDPASDAQDFDFDLTGAGLPADLDLDTDATNATLPSQQTFALTAAQLGPHSVTETVPIRWELDRITCTGDSEATVNMLTGSVGLDVDAGEQIVCEFRNEFIDLVPFKEQRNLEEAPRLDRTAPIPVELGDRVQYVIGVNNRGPGSAPNVVVSDLVPPRLRITSLGGCTQTSVDTEGTTISCVLGPIPAGQSRSTTIETKAVFGCEVVGTRGNDTLGFAQGVTNGDDLICGGGGGDTIFGHGGDDTIYGNQPRLDLTPIVNELWLDLDGDAIKDADELVRVRANPTDSMDGGDTIEGGTGGDWIDGQPGGDELHGQDGADEIHGSAGDDTITGDAGIDTITGDEGVDVINGGQGSDLINGGLGADSINGGDQGDNVFGGEGNDTIAGESLASTAPGPDILRGEDGNDTINGAGGDDTINGGEGADILRGADGDDTISGIGGPDDIAGGDGNDTITGGEASDDLFGNDGDDTINGGERGDTISGGNGHDRLFGDGAAPFPARDVIDGDAGNDRIDGNDGNDRLIGGTGNDTIEGNAGDDNVDGDAGTDTLSGEGGDDVIDGGSGSDHVNGGADDDQLWGGLDSDVVIGEGGRDRMAGDVGKNPLSTLGSPDHMNGGPGRDLMYGQGGSDCSTLLGSGDSAHPTCGAANRIPFDPGTYRAQMEGGGDADRLHGGRGNDRLDGGPEGGNALVGGEGSQDFCSFGPGAGDRRHETCELPSKGDLDDKQLPWRGWDWDLF